MYSAYCLLWCWCLQPENILCEANGDQLNVLIGLYFKRCCRSQSLIVSFGTSDFGYTFCYSMILESRPVELSWCASHASVTTAISVTGLKTRIALNVTPITELRGATCLIGSHSVTCHPTQVNTPHPNPGRQAGTWDTYPGGMKGWVDLGTVRPGVELATSQSQVQTTTPLSSCWLPLAAVVSVHLSASQWLPQRTRRAGFYGSDMEMHTCVLCMYFLYVTMQSLL